MDNCIFCKIIRGEIPCQKIAENNDFLAFLTIYPFTEGHTLIIPKKHFRWVNDVPNFGEYWDFSRKVSQKIQNKLNPNFISYLTVGNQVPHAHIHIIPRYENDSLIGMYDKYETHPTTEQLTILAAKIYGK